MSKNSLSVYIPGAILHTMKCAFTDSPSKRFPVLVNGVEVGEVVHRLQYGSWSHTAHLETLGASIELNKPLKECTKDIESIILNPKQDEINDIEKDFSEYVKILTNCDGKNRTQKDIDEILDKRRVEDLAGYATLSAYRILAGFGSDVKIEYAEITFPKANIKADLSDANENIVQTTWEKMKKDRRHAVDVIREYEALNGKIESDEQLESLVKEKKIDFSKFIQEKTKDDKSYNKGM